MKSVIEHSGGETISQGHYTASLLTKSGWTRCDDVSVIKKTNKPNQGYIFFYEKIQPGHESPLNETEQESVQNESDNNFVQNDTETVSKNNYENIKNKPQNSEECEINIDLDDLDLESENNDPKQTTEIGPALDILKAKRQSMVDALREGKEYVNLFKDNPILKAGIKMYKELSEWQMEEKCNVCNEAWFDQGKLKNKNICDRCRKESYREKECLTFSRDNDMIVSPIPQELNELNNIEDAAIKLIKPFVHIYKRFSGGIGFSGHCISFAQDVQKFAESLPWPVAELPLIIVQSKSNKDDRKFSADGRKIRVALNWLIANNDDYKFIKINEKALAEYPSGGGDLQGIQSLVDEDAINDAEIEAPLVVDDRELDKALDEQEINKKDMPTPNATVMEPLERETISNFIKKAAKEIKTSNATSVPWPDISEKPANEFHPGFFTKAFPRLFPDGKGDITKPRVGKTPTMRTWIEHLLKSDRRFAKDPLFVIVATNIMQKQQALALGNLYAERGLKNMTVKEMKERLEAGDSSILKSLYCFSSNIKGSQQMFSQHISKAYAFLRHLKISSENEEMFNLFLTFSAADNHWYALHKFLPGSEKYLYKKVVKNLNEIPESERDQYIDEKTDWILRSEAVRENQDIVNYFFQKRIRLIWKHILNPIFGGIDYICRYEFQHRGAIHCHMVISVKGGPNSEQMDLAEQSPPVINSNMTPSEMEDVKSKITLIEQARREMIRFNALHAGVYAVHPELDPKKWPAPLGQMPYKPPTEILRKNYYDYINDALSMYHHYIRMVNRVMIHKCVIGYCQSKNKAHMIKQKDKDGVEVKVRKLDCRFNFPFEMHGFDPVELPDKNVLDKVQVKIPKTEDELINPFIHGASYDEGKLTLLRNHPNLVSHIPEMLMVWGGNTDQKTISSYDQLVNYLLKYVMKPEKQSDYYSKLAQAVAKKIDDTAPLRKAAQKILMSNIGNRDMSLNECMLICHNLPYVEYSRTPRIANLKGSVKVKMSFGSENEQVIDEDNWQDVYWNKESSKEYKKLCEDYPDKFKYDKHPKDISLREFMVNFSKKWKYSPANVFPYFIPTYRYVVSCKKPHYQEWCKYILLQDKPGTNLENVGKNFDSCEAELQDFVDNSPFCPQLIKDEFKKSQNYQGLNKEGMIEDHLGDNMDELYIEPDGVPNNAPREEWMKVHAHENDPDDFIDELHRDEGSDYEDLGENNPEVLVDCHADSKELGTTEDDLRSAKAWISVQQKMEDLDEVVQDKQVLSPDQLNEKQKLAYDVMKNWFDKRVNDPNSDPIYLNISGRGGCGKSAFLDCLRNYIKNVVGDGFLKIAAPTGNAGFNVGGTTLHTLLALPIHASTKKELPELYGDRLQALQDKFEKMELIAIDEKSMLGCYMMYMIHQRLCQIRPRSAKKRFAGVSIILMGDFAQLPPVGDIPLYAKVTNKFSTYQIDGRLYFNELFVKNTLIFDEIMRQKGDAQKSFRGVLDRLSNGDFNKSDWEFLKERDLFGPNFSSDQRKEFLDSATMLCALNRDLKHHNTYRIKKLGTPIFHIKSYNSPESIKSAPSSEAQGLMSQMLIAKKMEIILTANLWKEKGLTNGAKGKILYIIYAKDRNPPMVPDFIIAKIYQYTGPSCLPNELNCVPIVPLTRNWYKNKTHCSRTMLPIKPAYAISIHGSQGLTMGNSILNVSKREFATGLTYTGISRVRGIENLVFYPMPNFRRFRNIFRSATFKDRLEHEIKEKDAQIELIARIHKEINENKDDKSKSRKNKLKPESADSVQQKRAKKK
ncbi:MAG: AAA family ATPase [Alphaproteobacteria bacterium]|nr:AAA family ATPase [Alphaproteobacteria bacterium]